MPTKIATKASPSAAVTASLGRVVPWNSPDRDTIRRIVGAGPGAQPAMVRRIAAGGFSGTAEALPHLHQIQASFGNHDVTRVKAHRAPDAAARLGAVAYASGDHVAFGAAMDLRTAAHEAAHVVQQRGGAQLSDGVGRAGDAYEREADEVAARVVGRVSASDILDRYGESPNGAGEIQTRAVQKQDAAPAPAPAPGAPAMTSEATAAVGATAITDAELAERIELAIAVYETNRDGTTPRPAASDLDTVPHTPASIASELQQTLPHLITTLLSHPELRALAHPPLTVAELRQARARENAAGALYDAVERSTGSADDFLRDHRALVTAAGLTDDELGTFIGGRDLHANLTADHVLLDAVRSAGATPPDDFVSAHADLITRSGATEAEVRALLAAVARPALVRALLAAIRSARQARDTPDAFITSHAAEIAAASVDEILVRDIFAHPAHGDRLRRTTENASSERALLRQIAATVPVQSGVQLEQGSLRAYIRRPRNFGENRQAWANYAINKLPDNIGQRLTEVGETDGGHPASVADVSGWLQPILGEQPRPSLRDIVQRVARRNNGAADYPGHVWAVYQRLYPLATAAPPAVVPAPAPAPTADRVPPGRT